MPIDTFFQVKRLLFSVRRLFAIAISKAQGQLFKIAGINLGIPHSSYEQLSMIYSRARTGKIDVIATGGETKNVVYQTALQ